MTARDTPPSLIAAADAELASARERGGNQVLLVNRR